MEEWRSLAFLGYDNYLVSDQGNVKGPNGLRKVSVGNDGYLRLKLSKDNVQKDFLLHRLVALAFIPNKNNLPEVNHINAIRADCNKDNLEWVNSQTNKILAIKTGADNIHSKLTQNQVEWIRANYKFRHPIYSMNSMARLFNVSSNCIGNIIKGHTWSFDTDN
ncbi:MAG: hypothetical protein RR324_01180 [Cellulosilyticaceae bacterium]